MPTARQTPALTSLGLAIVAASIALASVLITLQQKNAATIEQIEQDDLGASLTYRQWLRKTEQQKFTPSIKSRRSKEKFHLVSLHDSKPANGNTPAKHQMAKARVQELATKPAVRFASGYPIGRRIRGFLAELDPSDQATVPAVVIPNHVYAQSNPVAPTAAPATQTVLAEARPVAAEAPAA
eukprot:CAMPEP_0172177094 /NCGR_PEP_ID=MMETSP1050-20130122/15224_1 /TAXON_ID=233186 /ORGANISM="Cryptomonas curvata, Strain CCAP979/52" /LENGTH=181 /DNA_ID=CAMNT_0012849533 /DNA_START=24 /DNA_END=565 /DNA_ORIENTATION=-